MSKKKILVVEDNSDVRRLYAIALNQHGYEVKLAANGAEALTRIEDERPDLMVLDVFMPIMNGFEVIDKITLSSGAPIPVIVISGQATESESLTRDSILAWLSKPVALTELLAKIDEAFKPSAKRPHPPAERTVTPG